MGFVVERDHRRHRGKGFLAHAERLGRYVHNHGRLKEEAIGMVRAALAAAEDFGACRPGLFDVLQGGVEGLSIDQRADFHALGEAVSHFESPGSLDQGGHELVINRALHVDSIGRDARLARVAILGNQGSFDGLVQVGVVEDDHRGMSAQFQGEVFDLPGRSGDQLATDFGGAGEGDLATDRIFEQFGSNFGRLAGNQLEHAGWEADLVDHFGQDHGTQGRGAGRFEDHGTSGGQGGGHLAHSQHQGEVPGGDGADHTHRRLDYQVPFARGLLGHHSAVRSTGLAGEPLQVIHGHPTSPLL